MAILSSDGKYVTVQKGDTLSEIAETHLGSASKYKQLAAINNIPNPDYIVVNQKVYLDNSSTTTKKKASNKATITQFGLMSNTEDTLYAAWTWSKKNTESYKVLWTYYTGDGVWFVGNSSTNTVDSDATSVARQSTYTIPSNAKKVRFKVKPISKKQTKNGKETSYWTAEWSTVENHNVAPDPPSVPAVPTVEIDKFTLTAKLENINIDTSAIQFQINKEVDGVLKVFKTKTVDVVKQHAAYSCKIDAGGKYKVRCRAYQAKNKLHSEWTNYSAEHTTIPTVPALLDTVMARSESSVYVGWSRVNTATSYDVEYAKEIGLLGSTDETTVKTGIETAYYTFTGLETGTEWFFRVRAVNDKGHSNWTAAKSVVLGKPPAAPTTWSSASTVTVGEDLTLHWVHNTEDGSVQKYSELEIVVGETTYEYILSDKTEILDFIGYEPLSEDDKKKGKVETCIVNTASFDDGAKIKWRVRTCGVTNVLGEWSTQREIDIFAPPTLTMSLGDNNGALDDEVYGFPFYIHLTAGPNNEHQNPIGYHVTISSDESYTTTDETGNDRIVNTGELIYSRHFDTGSPNLTVELSAGNVDLQNNITYIVRCVSSMTSGLTAEAEQTFTVVWDEMPYTPNAEIGIDMETYTASIRPYCDLITVEHKEVKLVDGEYVETETVLPPTYGEPVKGAKTPSGDQIYVGVTADDGDTEIYYYEDEIRAPVTDALLSVYRREFDGSFVELATGLDSAANITISDPHPALDYARYRIVAVSKVTGTVSYYDVPGYPVQCKSVIIQWDEEWSSFDTTEDGLLERPTWAGSLLNLPYNIDVSDNNNPDVSLVEYIGREHPISYYGTHVGQSASWNVEIDKEDIDTLYALRRLSRWMGDVYVREPSGSGYWANITVSFNQKHRAVTIPVTLKVTRVEGGI